MYHHADYLIRIWPQHFHIFPGGGGVSQDSNMGSIRSDKGLYTKIHYQKDGSRFKTIYAKYLGSVDIARKVKINYPNRRPLWVETSHTTKKTITEAIETAYNNGDRLEYYAYLMHTFLNGLRYMPIVVNYTRQHCYNLMTLFDDYIPEDDLGVFVEDLYMLNVEKLGSPVEIDYQAHIRLCPCCGVVSNLAKPKQNPWLTRSKELL